MTDGSGNGGGKSNGLTIERILLGILLAQQMFFNGLGPVVDRCPDYRYGPEGPTAGQ